MCTDIDLEMFQKESGQYNAKLRQFATTLKFYSSKAYEHLRTILPLPSLRTVRGWLQGFNAKPGFTPEAFQLLTRLCAEDNIVYKHSTLMFDEITIRKHVEWKKNTNSISGLVDIGEGTPDDNGDEASVATDVLVFMLVGLTGHWKLPVGYFLVNHSGKEILLNLLTECLNRVHETGCRVMSIVCDGSFTNQSVIQSLGVSLDPESTKCTFCHPADPQLEVCVIFDVCHMLKLLRNMWATEKKLFLPGQKPICWDYVEKLVDVQQYEGLYAANKLRSEHIHFQGKKMKVRLSSQIFSESAADALRMAEAIGMPGFEDCTDTADYLHTVNNTFDICNSRFPFAYGSKSAINNLNYDDKIDQLQCTKQMLLSLKNAE